MNLVLHTPYFFFGAIDLMQGISFYFLWHREKQSYLLLWGLGFGISAVGFLIVPLRHSPLEPLSVIIASGTLITLGLALLHAGQGALLLQRGPQGRMSPYLLWSWPFTLTAIEPLALWWARSNPDRIDQVHSALLGMIAAFALAALARTRYQREQINKFGRRRRALAIFWQLLIAMMVTRIVFTEDLTRFVPSLAQVIHGVMASQVPGLVVVHVGLFAAFMTLHTGALNAEFRDRSTALKKSLEHLRWISETDELTDLANRRKFNETLTNEWARAMRGGQPLALLMIDIDHFKRYNDHYGHPEGDRCMEQVARILSEAARRPGDLAARYGGEEFALILPDTDSAGAERLAQKILDAVRAQRIPHAATPLPEGIVTLSIGVTSQLPEKTAHPSEPDASTQQGEDIPSAGLHHMERFIKRADAALYEAKRLGRNRMAVAVEDKLPASA